MKKRWRISTGAMAMALAGITGQIATIETQCNDPVSGLSPTGYTAQLTGGDARPEARTWLTYPEWHIVYSADSYARHLAAGQRPSAYPFMSDVKSFWGSFCQVNRVAQQAGGAGDAKLMIYTIGFSFTAEMLVKAAWENTVGRFAEAVSGWTSADDKLAARVQRDYGQFMHEVPWYKFDFGRAFDQLWGTSPGDQPFRHWERRIALSLEYGVKAGYAKALGWASGNTIGPDEVRLRMLVLPGGADLAAIDPDLKVLGDVGGAQKVDAPRYARLTTILARMADGPAQVVEIAGNDDLLVTFLVPPGKAAALTMGQEPTLRMPLADRPGWERVGLTVKVPALMPTLRIARGQGAQLEHVYDY